MPGGNPFNTDGSLNKGWWETFRRNPNDPSLGLDKQKTNSIFDRLNRQSSTTNSSGTNPFAGVSSVAQNVIGQSVDAVGAAYYDRLSATSARISTSTIAGVLSAVGTSITSFNPLAMANGLVTAVGGLVKQSVGNLMKIEDQLIERVMGAGGFVGDIGKGMMTELNEAMITASELGMNVDDFMDATKVMLESSGRMAIYNRQAITSGVEASLAYTKSTKTLLENTEKFRDVGYGLQDAAEAIDRIGQRSIALGLNAKNVSDGLIKNIDKLNQFGFQNGIDGLSKMVQEAQALNFNVENTFKVANDLFDPAKAIELTANMQVLGGAIGDLNSPLKLMYDATNNVEGLQTSILGAARSLATYNAEQGRFEVSGANLRRAKAMADALGISMGDLTSAAVKGASKMQALNELMMFPGLSQDQREFMSNLATMKGGTIGFSIPDDVAEKIGVDKSELKDGFIAADKLSQEQVIQLGELQKKIASTSTQEVARQQYNETTKIFNVVSAMYLRQLTDSGKTDAARTGRAITSVGAEFLQTYVKDGRLQDMTLQQAGEITSKMMQSKFAGENKSKSAEEQKQKDLVKPPTPAKQEVDVKVSFGPSPDVMSGMSRELVKNPYIVNEWISDVNPRSFQKTQNLIRK
jgi:hypothetical protein